MPIIQGPGVTVPSDDFSYWGLVSFKAGERNITELHFHDCDDIRAIAHGCCGAPNFLAHLLGNRAVAFKRVMEFTR
jgi:hypothetical protein